MGNPHAVIFLRNLEELENLDLNSIGPRLEKHSAFPDLANIEFVTVILNVTNNYLIYYFLIYIYLLD